MPDAFVNRISAYLVRIVCGVAGAQLYDAVAAYNLEGLLGIRLLEIYPVERRQCSRIQVINLLYIFVSCRYDTFYLVGLQVGN